MYWMLSLWTACTEAEKTDPVAVLEPTDTDTEKVEKEIQVEMQICESHSETCSLCSVASSSSTCTFQDGDAYEGTFRFEKMLCFTLVTYSQKHRYRYVTHITL